jgi:hypothetical protein
VSVYKGDRLAVAPKKINEDICVQKDCPRHD